MSPCWFFFLQELSVALYRHLLGLPENEASPDQPVVAKDLNLLCCDIDAALIERAQQCSPFPASIHYTTLDIMDAGARESSLSNFLSKFGRSTFDICFCMSVTMWIHLNHGDNGLVEFLSCLASLCEYLLIEPQPWKCYRAAARRLRKLGRNDFDHFRSLAISGDMAEKVTQILTRDGAMELVCCFGSTSWDRSLLLFKSNALTQKVPWARAALALTTSWRGRELKFSGLSLWLPSLYPRYRTDSLGGSCWPVHLAMPRFLPLKNGENDF